MIGAGNVDRVHPGVVGGSQQALPDDEHDRHDHHRHDQHDHHHDDELDPHVIMMRANLCEQLSSLKSH